MWWGTRLLNLYWSSTLTEVGKALFPTGPSPSTWNNTPIWTKAQMVFTPNITTDITATSYFSLNYFFLAADSSIHNTQDDGFPQESLYNNNSTVAYSGPLTEALTWSKIMSSMILTDLGDSQSPNILQAPSLLQWALQYPDDIFRDQLNARSCPWNGSVSSPCDPKWYNYLGV